MKVIGHRGARGLAPENTLAAFKLGLKYNVDELELDVRVTKDLVPVLNHNFHLNSPVGRHLFISRHTYAELKAAKPDLLTLDEIIKFVDRRTELRIEVKWPSPVEPVVKVIGHYLSSGWTAADFSLGSFNQPILRRLHQALPDLPLVIIGIFPGRSYRRAKELHAKRLSLSYRVVSARWLRRFHTENFRLALYSINKPSELTPERLTNIYAVITDYPDRFEAINTD